METRYLQQNILTPLKHLTSAWALSSWYVVEIETVVESEVYFDDQEPN